MRQREDVYRTRKGSGSQKPFSLQSWVSRGPMTLTIPAVGSSEDLANRQVTCYPHKLAKRVIMSSTQLLN
jgi:hypothetical protein